VRSPSSQHPGFARLFERLDEVARKLNPILLFVAVALVVLNLACVVNLIDWRDPVQHAPDTTTEATAPPAAHH